MKATSNEQFELKGELRESGGPWRDESWLGLFLHRDRKWGKLFTVEDDYSLHKTLGALACVSFVYRYAYVYLMTGTLGFDGKPADWIFMASHLFLSCSSLIFSVPKKRIPARPMVIYEEYRLHAAVFTARCFSVFAVAMLVNPLPFWLVPLVVALHHLTADYITSIHGTPNNTAVRATAAKVKESTFYRMVAKLYSFYQFLAIASHILPNERLGDLGFNALIAIQSSAFLMTLFRKRIIRSKTHMIVYGFCLIVSTFHIIRLLPPMTLPAVLLVFLLRITLPSPFNSKYLLWAAFVCGFHFFAL